MPAAPLPDVWDAMDRQQRQRESAAQRDLAPTPTHYIDKDTGLIGDASNLLLLTGEIPEDIADAPDSMVINFGLEYGTPLDQLI